MLFGTEGGYERCQWINEARAGQRRLKCFLGGRGICTAPPPLVTLWFRNRCCDTSVVLINGVWRRRMSNHPWWNAFPIDTQWVAAPPDDRSPQRRWAERGPSQQGGAPSTAVNDIAENNGVRLRDIPPLTMRLGNVSVIDAINSYVLINPERMIRKYERAFYFQIKCCFSKLMLHCLKR